jgi:Mn-dependent DtxR family transcriptional regulator
MGQQYLIVTYIAEQRGSGAVRPGEIADDLGRSPAATTEMLQRLEDRGLVTYEPYEGATLTPEGRETAAELYETYTVLSRFFEEVLGLEDHEREAIQLAGTVSPDVAERLDSALLAERDADTVNADDPGNGDIVE